MQKFKWGIMAAGRIAHLFAESLELIPDAEVFAVGSRTKAKAAEFAAKYNAPKAYGSYEELAADPEIDCIYIATPHPYHMPNALLCIENNKHVLCEKPFGVNAREAKIMLNAAAKKGVYIMEAFWTRFLPAIKQARQWLEDGRIGKIRMLQCDFSFVKEPYDPQGRVFSLALAGGGLLDVGCYPICATAMLLGNEPSTINGVAEIGVTGVDEQAGMLLGYPSGQIAVLSCGVRTNADKTLNIYGEKGVIRVPNFWSTDRAILELPGSPPVEFVEREGTGYHYEALAVMEDIRAGRLQNALVPHTDTLAIAKIMDELRRQWGLVYESDKNG